MNDSAPTTDFPSSLRLRLANASRVALLAVGSQLCGDDGVGQIVARRLACEDSGRPRCAKGQATRTGGARPVLTILTGGSAPENLAGEIRRFRPTHLVVVDAADLGARPGAVALLSRETLRETLPSTHRPSLELLLAYVVAEVGCQVVVIGIQPRSTDFGSTVSREVRATAGEVAALIRESLG